MDTNQPIELSKKHTATPCIDRALLDANALKALEADRAYKTAVTANWTRSAIKKLKNKADKSFNKLYSYVSSINDDNLSIDDGVYVVKTVERVMTESNRMDEAEFNGRLKDIKEEK